MGDGYFWQVWGKNLLGLGFCINLFIVRHQVL